MSSKRKGDVECLRQLLNRDTLTQLELVVCVIRLITPLDWRIKMCCLKGRAIRQLLNRDALTQLELVVLCHHAMGLANKNVSSKRKGDVECLRQLLNRDTLTQLELEVLCHQTYHAIGLANKNVSSKRKGEEIQDRPKRQKVAGQSVCFCYYFTCFK